MKLVSKFAVGIPTGGINTPLNYVWRIVRSYIFKPEVILFSIILFVIFIYLQTVDTWSRSLIGKIQHTLGRTTSKVDNVFYI